MSKKNEQTTIEKSLGAFAKVEGCEWATLTPEVGA
jgi:hypothetical protein